jgi:type IV secretion system protein VirD4
MIRALWACLCRVALVAALGLMAASLAFVSVYYPVILVFLLLAVLWQKARRWKGGWSHGRARFITVGELNQCGMLGDDGVILGRVGWADLPSRWSAALGLLSLRIRSDIAVGLFLAAFFKSRWASNRIIRANDYVHLASFSRTGGGKGVSVVIPTLRSYRGSVVSIDPKCENFNLTAEFRRKRMGHRIVRLDPMLLGGPGADSFNPLAFISPSDPDFLDQCRDIAGMLVLRTGKEPDPHWNDVAELVLTGAIAFVCACEPDPKERTLPLVRELLASRDHFTRMADTMRKVQDPVVRRMGDQLAWLVDKELSSVMTTVQRHTAWMDSPAVAACMTTNSFDPASLRSGKVSVYLVLPPERLAGTLAPLMRMWLGSILRIVSRTGADERRQVLFLLDEVAQLGRMQALEDATTIMRGYGIRLWYIFQSLQQEHACYGEKAGVILDNIGTQQFFAVNSYETAEAISKRIGEETIRLTTPNSSTSTSNQTGAGSPQSNSRSSSSGLNTTELARRVLKPEEILVLPEDVALVFHRNLPVIPARLLRYYNAPEFGKRGTGKRRGLGMAAGIAAMFTLLFSVAVAMVVSEMPMPVRAWRPGMPGAAYMSVPWQGSWTPRGLPSLPSLFQKLKAWAGRPDEPSIVPQPQRRTVATPRQRRRRETTFSQLIRIE